MGQSGGVFGVQLIVATLAFRLNYYALHNQRRKANDAILIEVGVF